MTPVYSICMCNYNMAHTLEQAVTSVAAQLDDRFEIVLVDDGSSDDSVSIMRKLAAQYSIIRVMSLKRDRSRKLGATRNFGIREARGQYCLLHIDCDDVWEPHLAAWVEVFHQIETAIGEDILLVGQQVKMARRDLLVRHGPYPNLFRMEDSKMRRKFSALGHIWLLEHDVFRTRVAHPPVVRWRRSIHHTVDIMITECRFGSSFMSLVRQEVATIPDRSFRLTLFRLVALPVTWCLAKFMQPVEFSPMLGYREYKEYEKAHRGTFVELMSKHSTVPDWSRVPSSSRPIFDR